MFNVFFFFLYISFVKCGDIMSLSNVLSLFNLSACIFCLCLNFSHCLAMWNVLSFIFFAACTLFLIGSFLHIHTWAIWFPWSHRTQFLQWYVAAGFVCANRPREDKKKSHTKSACKNTDFYTTETHGLKWGMQKEKPRINVRTTRKNYTFINIFYVRCSI